MNVQLEKSNDDGTHDVRISGAIPELWQIEITESQELGAGRTRGQMPSGSSGPNTPISDSIGIDDLALRAI